MKNKSNPLVSIITSSYNREKYIAETIESVLNQTYQNYEMIIVDDISTDNTIKIIKEYQKKDKRIKLIKLSEKGGTSIARNRAILEAKGKYVAFLDSDDLWYKDKLEKQIKFMEENNIYFSYTDYEYINEKSELINLRRIAPKKVTYLRMLLGNYVGCLTVVYNAEETGLIQIPKIDKRNDYALWCFILNKLRYGYKYDEVLAKYRKAKSNSLSSGNKFKLIKYHYQLHHKINKFNPITSCFLIFTNAITSFLFKKRIREKNRIKTY
ncbi:MAG: glycosyltransferase family 2 protein [Bacilli bacterium]|nr:glycosyltransferase family 2 protein [Bacilli bacterium]MDD4809252.1 glycosyltransferase family 2 protein [Bacilli bacterium]